MAARKVPAKRVSRLPAATVSRKGRRQDLTQYVEEASVVKFGYTKSAFEPFGAAMFLSFDIPSKGGGDTSIRVRIDRSDLPALLSEIAAAGASERAMLASALAAACEAEAAGQAAD